MTRRLVVLLAFASVAVVVQQQVLLRRPPRLNSITSQQIQSGSAALDLQFSRPMNARHLAAETQLTPALPHRWLGSSNPLRLIIERSATINTPIALDLAGDDQRQTALKPQRWWWDPRPWLLVVRQLETGQQVQLLDRQGRWQALSPIWPQISQLVPLGNGQGIAMVSSDHEGQEQIWLQPLQTSNRSQERDALQPPHPLALEPLTTQPVLFGHLSSNLQGDLLVQSGGLRPDSKRVTLIRATGSRRELKVSASGPIALLPPGGGLVVPGYDSIRLRPVVDNGRAPQTLPGSRELGAFCAASGRAILIRHWPDYRRSIELVIPGLAPRQLWLGDEAILAVSCDGSGDRIWAVLGRWQDNQGAHEILLMNGEGTVLKRNKLAPRTVRGGSQLQFDPVSNRLLLTVVEPGQSSGQPGFLDADSLEWDRVLPVAVDDAQWLRS